MSHTRCSEQSLGYTRSSHDNRFTRGVAVQECPRYRFCSLRRPVSCCQIDARLGQGEDTLQQLLDAGQADLYDFAFIGQYTVVHGSAIEHSI